jgi:glycine/D-amino acid oxidase-like deaminating enzyme
MKTDYIIVGCGLAGIAVAEELRSRGKTFVVFEDESQTSSLVAGGMYNPVVLKRFNPVWRGAEQLDVALPFYKRLEDRFEKSYDKRIDILRIFKSIEEQNNWYSACDKPRLKCFLEPEIEKNNNSSVHAEYLLGRVRKTGRVVVRELVNDYRRSLSREGRLRSESFEHLKLEHSAEGLRYGSMEADRIVFCEGNGMAKNPFFKDLPLEGTKGELITIHAPDLKLKEVLKSAVFVMPLGDDLYKIGATFNWTDKTNVPTAQGREELLDKLKKVISCDFEIRDHEAGVRPTTHDRRPLLGIHAEFTRLSVLNGLGTRGVMSAPYLAKQLLDFLEAQASLDSEIDISRFSS